VNDSITWFEEKFSGTKEVSSVMMIFFHRCELIALGNGTACRETESYLSGLIQNGWFYPLDVKFTIVSEQGASIYSCSPIAQKEFPGTDPNVISAGNCVFN
jgi:transcriptional accessory protein Tex/SPT6